jgi:hypothetical protein
LSMKDTHGGDRTICEHGRWAPASKYEYTVSVLGLEAISDTSYVVTGRLDGDFPGGIADLHFHFTLAQDRIGRLEIAPP